MWVVRAGQKAKYFKDYIDNRKIYIPWDGYKLDLSKFNTIDDFRKIVFEEKGTDNNTISISNWAMQLFAFVKEMRTGDYLLIPSEMSRTYCLAKIKGDYNYNHKTHTGLSHSRDIEVINTNVPRNIFVKKIQYSLGAYRTIFKTKYEAEILKTISEWEELNNGR